jgi:hypothetical protein
MSHPHHKAVILSEALGRYIGNRGFMARNRRTSTTFNLPMLPEAFHHYMRTIHPGSVLEKVLLPGFGA